MGTDFRNKMFKKAILEAEALFMFMHAKSTKQLVGKMNFGTKSAFFLFWYQNFSPILRLPPGRPKRRQANMAFSR